MKTLIFMSFVALAVQSQAAIPQVNDVAIRQEGGTLIVSYRLTGAPAVVTVDFQTNGVDGAWVSLGPDVVSRLSGAVNRRVEMSEGVNEIVWKAGKDWPHVKVNAGELRAAVRAHDISSPPEWMTVGLVDGEVRYYETIGEVPGGKFDARYKGTHLLMRKIPAACASFRMGRSEYDERFSSDEDETPHEVRLTKDFYMAIVETTQAQYVNITGENPSNNQAGDFYPVEQITYQGLRGTEGASWPADAHAVDENSFFGILRRRTGLPLDLPTEAQWEYACRATTTTHLNNNKDLKADSEDFIEELDEVAWCAGNAQTTQPVMGKMPNAWGLYDMHGNVYEMCLDWYGVYPGTCVDPVGPSSGSVRVSRGGSFRFNSGNLRSSKRASWAADVGIAWSGFRICVEAKAIK